MLCVTRSGDICQVMAVHLPVREPAPRRTWVRRAERSRRSLAAARPTRWHAWALNPADRPARVGQQPAHADGRSRPAYFFPTSERVERLYAPIERQGEIEPRGPGLAATGYVVAFRSHPENGPDRPSSARWAAAEASSPSCVALESWDGRLRRPISAGPLPSEALDARTGQRLLRFCPTGKDAEQRNLTGIIWCVTCRRTCRRAPEPDRRTAGSRRALDAAAAAARATALWGDINPRALLGHALAGVHPLSEGFSCSTITPRGRLAQYDHGRRPTALVNGRHDVTFRQPVPPAVRYVGSGPSEFVLPAGRRGRPGSAARISPTSVELWAARGAPVTMPLTRAAVAAQFPTVTRLTPGSPALVARHR